MKFDSPSHMSCTILKPYTMAAVHTCTVLQPSAMNCAASRQVPMPPMPLSGRPAGGASRAIPATLSNPNPTTPRPPYPPPHPRVDGVDQRHRVGPAGPGGARGLAHIGDVGRELDDHRQPAVVLTPGR